MIKIMTKKSEEIIQEQELKTILVDKIFNKLKKYKNGNYDNIEEYDEKNKVFLMRL